MFTQQATSMNSTVYDNEAIIYTSRDSVINRFLQTSNWSFCYSWFQANGTGTVRINLTRFAYPINFGERWKGFSANEQDQRIVQAYGVPVKQST
jgi:hypothetical protein